MAIADTQTPLAGAIAAAQPEIKTAATTKKKSAAVKADAVKEEKVSETDETVEADAKLEEQTEAVAEDEVAEDEATTPQKSKETIQDEAAPLAAEDNGFNPALLISVIVVIAIAGAAGVVVYRKKN